MEQKKCQVEGCKREYRAKGYCEYHYKKWRNGEYGHSRYKTCTAEACNKKRFSGSSLCEVHYKEQQGAKAQAAPAATPVVTPVAAPEVKPAEAPKTEVPKEEAKQ